MNAVDLDKAVIGNYSILTSETNLLGADIFLRWGTAAPDVWEAWITEIEEENSRILPIDIDETQVTLSSYTNFLKESVYGGVAFFVAGEKQFQFLDL